MSKPQSSDVLLLAAGFGTRLAPLTDTKPKPLVEVQGKPLIDWNLELLASQGFSRVIVNLHYLPEKIQAYLSDGSRYGLEIVYSLEPVILDTGGAIKKIDELREHDDLLVINSDTLFSRTFSFQELLLVHQESPKGNLATLTLRRSEELANYGKIGIDRSGRIVSFLDILAPDSDDVVDEFMFAGAHIISRELVEQFPPERDVFSITRDVYGPQVASGGHLSSYVFAGAWSDCGTFERLKEAENLEF